MQANSPCHKSPGFFYTLKAIGAVAGLGLLIWLMVDKSFDSVFLRALFISFAATLLILEKLLKGIAFDMDTQGRKEDKRLLEEWSLVLGIFGSALGVPAIAATIVALA